MSRPRKIALIVGGSLAGLFCLVLITGIVVVQTQWFRDFVRTKLVSVLEDSTGARVEIGSFDFDWTKLRAQVRGIVLHGTEPAGSAPLFRAALLEVDLKLTTPFRRFVDIAALRLDQPQAAVLVFPDGRTNIPEPKARKTSSDTSGLQTIVDLAIGRFDLTNGTVAFADRKTPLEAHGQNLRALLTYNLAKPGYGGNLSMRPLVITSAGNTPLALDISLPVALEADRIRLTNGTIRTPESQIVVSADVDHLVSPHVAAQLSARISLAEVQRTAGSALPLAIGPDTPQALTAEARMDMDQNRILVNSARITLGQSVIQASGPLKDVHAPNPSLNFQADLAVRELGRMLRVAAQPEGAVQIRGNARLGAANNYTVTANLDAHDLAFRQGTTRFSGIRITSAINANPTLVELTGLHVAALGGIYDGRVALQNNSDLLLTGKLDRFDLQELARTFGGRRVGWAGLLSGTVEAHDNLHASGTTGVSAQAHLAITPRRSGVPMSGRIQLAYNGASGLIDAGRSYIALPSTRLDFSGSLGRRIDVRLSSHNLADFQPALSGPLPVTLNRGNALLTASVVGSLSAPHVTGHVAMQNFALEGRSFSSLALDLEASKSGAAIRNGSLTRASALDAGFAASVGLRNWKPAPPEPLQANLTIRNADLQDLLVLAGQSNMPVSGALTATADVNGTVGDPRGSLSLTVLNGHAYQQHFDRLQGQVILADRLVSVPSFDLTAGSSRVSLNATFSHPPKQLTTGVIRAHLSGNQVQLDQFSNLTQKHPDLAGTVQLLADATANLQQVAGKTEVQLASATADVHARGLQMQGRHFGNLDLTAGTAGSSLSYKLTSDFAGSAIAVNGQTTLAAGYPTSASASIRNLAVEKALDTAGRSDLPVTGVLTADARLTGTTTDPHADATWSITKGKAYGEPFDSLDAHLIFSNSSVELPQLGVTVEGSHLQATASFAHPANDYQSGQLQFRLSGDPLQLARFRRLQAIKPGLAGTLQLSADGAGTLRPAGTTPRIAIAHLNADIEAAGLAVDRRPVGSLKASAVTHGTTVAFQLQSDFAHSDIRGTGQLDLTGDYPLNARVSFAKITYAGLQDWIGSDGQRTLDGTLAGSLSVNGPAARPDDLNGSLELQQLEVHGSALPGGTQIASNTTRSFSIHNPAPIVVRLDHSVVRIQSASLTGSGTNLNLTGTASIRDPKPLDVRLNANVGLDLLQAFEPELFATGAVTVTASVQGTAANPAINGRLQLQNASLNSMSAPTGLSDANGTIVFNGHQAVIQNITGKTGGGTVSLAGVIGYTPQVNMRLTAKANRIRVTYPETLTTLASANLTLDGTTQRSLLSGSVNILGITMQSQSDVGSLLSSGGPPSAPGSGTGLVGGMHLDVRIDTSSGMQFKTSLAQNIQAEAHVRLRGTAASPGMIGRVDVSQGEAVFFGNKYTVDEGTITFSNPNRIEPVLNVSLSTSAQGVSVTLSVSGPMDRLALNYSSDPPMQLSDLIGLLATGKAPTTDPVLAVREPAEPQQSLQQKGASAVLGQAVGSPVSGRLQRLFGVSSLKIDPQILGLDNSPQARLTLEQQISKTLTFTYIQDVTESNPQTIRIEWSPAPKWSAVALRDENGYFGVDIYYKKRIK